jgi:hypothetical protein
MSGKRSRKVAFKDDVDNLDIEDKKRKELENDRNSEKRSIKMMNQGLKRSIAWTVMRKMR